ncbi:MAG: N-acetylmuramoyl-L-alanine amidase family protein [Gemmatimonadales bacterium]
MKRLLPRAGLVILGAACSTTAPEPAPAPLPAVAPDGLPPLRSSTRLPEVPEVEGPLDIRVVYPPRDATVQPGDSSFIFGSVGNGSASVTINGDPIRVWPNGAWLAWVPFPPDTLMRFTIEARTADDSAVLEHPVRRPAGFSPPPGPVWINQSSISPRGRIWWPADEYLPVSVRAASGARVRLVLPDSTIVPLTDGLSNLVRAPVTDRYTGLLRGRALGTHPGPMLGDSARMLRFNPPDTMAELPDSLVPEDSVTDPAGPMIEAIIGVDTARAPWPVHLALLDSMPVAVTLDDDTAASRDTDGITVGRAAPDATYHWFFPAGTHALATARVNGDTRLSLSRNAVAWVAASDVVPLPAGTAQARATVGSVSLSAGAEKVSLRIPVSRRVPFRVIESGRTLTVRLYGSAGDVNWIRYGGTDPAVRAISWNQDTGDEVTIAVELAEPPWGFRTRWSQSDLILEIHRPPLIDPDDVLRNLLVVVDPGHPPAGATGPTGLAEAEANLAVALRLRDLLAESGARVIMTRTTGEPLGLRERTTLADSLGADLLVSIHNNALPDGVNPFTNNGVSVYYNHPRSIPLAMHVQQSLVKALGTRDLGIGRGDLALVRPTWMPAILTEGFFMMLPDQESALRQEAGQLLYAEAVHEGIVAFLRERAGGH